jgi:PBP1b-binding outer membrane lipoprotein LpoB
MVRILPALPVVLGACLAAGQDKASVPPVPESEAIPVKNLPIDSDKLADAMRDSYYHPDNLAALECNVSFDWSGVLHALKIDLLETEQAKIVDGLKVRTRAARNEATEVTLTWTGGEPPENKARIESAIKK